MGACSARARRTPRLRRPPPGRRRPGRPPPPPRSSRRRRRPPAGRPPRSRRPGRCATAALTGSVVGSSGAAGTIETTVALKSTATAPVHRWAAIPGLQMLGRLGAAAPHHGRAQGDLQLHVDGPHHGDAGPGPVGRTSTSATRTCRWAPRPRARPRRRLEVTPPNAFDHLVIGGGAGALRGRDPGGVTGVPGHRGRQPDHRATLRLRPTPVGRPGRDRDAPASDPGPRRRRIRSRTGARPVEVHLLPDHVVEQCGREGGGHLAPDPPALVDRGRARCRRRSA